MLKDTSEKVKERTGKKLCISFKTLMSDVNV